MDNSIFFIMDLIGIVAFSISGAIAAMRKKMDVYGVFILATITALGGGMLRDVLIGNTPVMALTTPLLVAIPAGITLTAFFAPFPMGRGFRTLLVMDAIGIGIFTVSGVTLGLEFGVPFHGSVILGVITSTAGGITRDLLSGEVPLVLRRDIYASASVIGGALYWTLIIPLNMDNIVSALLCTAIIIIIRVLSYERGWHLPYPHKSRMYRRRLRKNAIKDD